MPDGTKVRVVDAKKLLALQQRLSTLAQKEAGKLQNIQHRSFAGAKPDTPQVSPPDTPPPDTLRECLAADGRADRDRVSALTLSGSKRAVVEVVATV